MSMDLAATIAYSLAAQDETEAVIEAIPDAGFAEASALPGWTVSHVVGHLIGNAEAQARQIDYALRGERIEVYSGGQQFRDAEIEHRTDLTPLQLRTELTEQHERYSAAATEVDHEIAQFGVEFRSGTVLDVLNGRWMECLVHAVDLGQPHFTRRNWDIPFCTQLIGYLLERLPSDRAFRLTATDADLDIRVGEGDPRLIEAPIADLAGFLSERGPTLAADVQFNPYPRGSITR